MYKNTQCNGCFFKLAPNLGWFGMIDRLVYFLQGKSVYVKVHMNMYKGAGR